MSSTLEHISPFKTGGTSMIQVDFDEDTLNSIRFERLNHPHPRVRLRIEVLWLKYLGYPHEEIATIADVSINTVAGYLKRYRDGGLAELLKVRFNRPSSKLAKHSESIENYFKTHPPASVKEATAKIKELTGVGLSESQVRKFLKNLGMQYRKVGMIPAGADLEKQEKFFDDELSPRLEEAKTGKRSLFFGDASHFVLAPYLGFLWSFARVFVKAPAGRKRFNVLGALNAVTHELITVTNDTYINAVSFCELLIKLAELGLNTPITIVLDNARYQKCALVFEYASRLGIELLYLPPYSPNLNLIERLWKFVKKEVLYSKYYSNFIDFKRAINDCLERTHTTHKKSLDSLLRLRFQNFKKSPII